MPTRPQTAEEALAQMQGGQYWDPMDKAMRGTTQTESPEQTLAYLKTRYKMGNNGGNNNPAQTPGSAPGTTGPGPTPTPTPTPAPAPAPTPTPAPASAPASGGSGGGGGAAPSIQSLASAMNGPAAAPMPVALSPATPMAAPESLRPMLGARTLPQYSASLAALQRRLY